MNFLDREAKEDNTRSPVASDDAPTPPPPAAANTARRLKTAQMLSRCAVKDLFLKDSTTFTFEPCDLNSRSTVTLYDVTMNQPNGKKTTTFAAVVRATRGGGYNGDGAWNTTHLLGAETNFKSSFGFQGVAVCDVNVDPDALFQPVDMFTAIEHATRAMYFKAADHCPDLAGWFIKNAGARAVPKTDPRYVAAPAISGVSLVVAVVRFREDFSKYLFFKYPQNHPIQHIGARKVIRPFNLNEVSLRERPTDNFDKYADYKRASHTFVLTSFAESNGTR